MFCEAQRLCFFVLLFGSGVPKGGGNFIPLRFEYYVVSRSELLDKVAFRIHEIYEKAQGLHILRGVREGPRRSLWTNETIRQMRTA